MGRIGFDNEKYIKMQSEQIRKRIGEFGGKLYLEFGGKLFDDTHASRVLPGFQPDSKLKMLLQLKDQAEIVIAVSAEALHLPEWETCDPEQRKTAAHILLHCIMAEGHTLHVFLA